MPLFFYYLYSSYAEKRQSSSVIASFNMDFLVCSIKWIDSRFGVKSRI